MNFINKKPELLLPAGSIESFYAAIQAGADAIYLGLKTFNARNRATNFTFWQAAAAVKEAHKRNIKVYIVLNTIIKNNELPNLLDTLFVLTQIKPDAVIVQDWGVFYLIKNFFPQLIVHASTQMGNHNSAGLQFSSKVGFKRVVLARELTKNELESMVKRSSIEKELFVHGALCYSFSGMCLFSSFLGGASANRGQCTQPCRRNYKQNNNESYFFSLKDNQLIEHISFIQKLGIESLKIEGRLKPAEYVYKVACNYRNTIDKKIPISESINNLRLDLGREKTDYFFGKNISEAITQLAGTGLLIGKVIAINNGNIEFTSSAKLANSCRLRFRNPQNDIQTDFNISQLFEINNIYSFQTKSVQICVNDEVYLAGDKLKFPDTIKTDGIKINVKCPNQKANQIRSALIQKEKTNKSEIFVRIDNFNIIEYLKNEPINNIIIQPSKKEWEKISTHLVFLKKIKKIIFLELPKFISENDIEFYRNQLLTSYKLGIKNFFLSHLSQVEILPKGSTIHTNENVYIFNDASISFLKKSGVQNYVYPFENDIVNMAKGTDRKGIVPMYFIPELFYSRMPVNLKRDEIFKDKNGEIFKKTIKNGITLVLPQKAVSITQFKSKLERYNFNRFLIDLSHSELNHDQIKKVIKNLINSETINNTSLFNFKRELK